MADKKNKQPKKVFSFTFNFSWLYLLLIIGIGYMLFANRSSSAEKIEWQEAETMIMAGDVDEIVFIRNDFRGEVKVRPERLAKYADHFANGVPPRRAPHFFFLVSGKFDPEVTFAELNDQLLTGEKFKVVVKEEEHIWGEML